MPFCLLLDEKITDSNSQCYVLSVGSLGDVEDFAFGYPRSETEHQMEKSLASDGFRKLMFLYVLVCMSHTCVKGPAVQSVGLFDIK